MFPRILATQSAEPAWPCMCTVVVGFPHNQNRQSAAGRSTNLPSRTKACLPCSIFCPRVGYKTTCLRQKTSKRVVVYMCLVQADPASSACPALALGHGPARQQLDMSHAKQTDLSTGSRVRADSGARLLDRRPHVPGRVSTGAPA